MATKFPKPSIAVPAILLFDLIGGATAHAQVATDGTVGPRVELGGPEFDIGADLGRQAGRNLFHSFEHFSLATGERATFSGPDAVRNVISRVTGGEASDIDGTIRSTIPAADFYFINPAGILFGPNASLDVEGSFHVSTADELRFADRQVLRADLDARSSFTVARPEAFGFLGGDRGTLSVADSRLQVRPGEAISLVGGPVTIAGGSAEEANPTIGANRGTITVGAVGVEGGQFAIRSGQLDAPDRAAVRVTDGAFMDTSGNGAGLIRIRGGRVLIRDGSFVFSDNDGSLDAPSRNGVDVDAHALRLRANSLVTADVVGGGTGRGGAVSVRAGKVEIADGSRVAADTFAEGDAGSVSVTAGKLEILNGGAIRSNTTGRGDAGVIKIEVAKLRISSESVMSESTIESVTRGDGKGGVVDINGADIVVDFGLIGANTFGTNEQADAGSVIINADSLHFVNEGRIFNGTNGSGDGGDIHVTAHTIVADATVDHDSRFHTGIASTAEAGSTGASGNITLDAHEIRLIDGGLIATSTAGRGDAGEVAIEVAKLHISSESVMSESTIESVTRGDGKGGVVDINGGDIVVDFGLIGANTFGTNEQADAGSVIINAASLHFVNEGRIFNGTNGPGDGGDVDVTADTIIADARVDHRNRFHTGIASTAEADSTGASGDVTVRADEIRLLHGGLIATSSQGFGNAGNAFVVVEESLGIRGRSADRPSSISVSSQNPFSLAAVGNLEIEAPVVEVSDGGRIEATNAGLGRSGGVTLEAQTLRLENGAAITAGSDRVDAGDIVIMVEELVHLRRSSIATSAADGEGGGGNILIHPRFVVLDRSQIVATARRGAGGSIVVVADNFIQSPDSVLDASSDLGLPGTVVISSPEIDLSGGLVVLEGALLDAASQLRERCGARRDIGASSFTAAGRGGLPASPNAPLPSAYRSARSEVSAAGGHSTATPPARTQVWMNHLADCASAP